MGFNSPAGIIVQRFKAYKKNQLKLGDEYCKIDSKKLLFTISQQIRHFEM